MEWNKGRRESRTLRSQPIQAEDIGFPFAAQIARLHRQVKRKRAELTCLITSLPPTQLDASQWLANNRLHWGIENGLHQRLDTSLGDDFCRVRTPRGLWILGMFRRFVVSLFMEWRSHHHRPKHQTTTDFQAAMEEDNLRPAFRFVTSRRPSLNSLS